MRLVVMLMLLGTPAMAQGLDCEVRSRCLEGAACKPPESLRVKVRPDDDGRFRFDLADDPEHVADLEVIGSVTRFTTEPVFGFHWALLAGPTGDAAITVAATGFEDRLVTVHFVGRCEPA